MSDSIKNLESDKYLGDTAVVNRLLRGFAHTLLTSELESEEWATFAEEEAKKLAKVFLGQKKGFTGNVFNTPGHIDEHVAEECGIESTDPVERVAGGLLKMGSDLYSLVQEHDPDWKKKSDKILSHYTSVFIGIPSVLMI